MPNINNVEGWFSDDDISVYRSLVDSLNDNSKILELGCFKGKSICSISDIINKKKIKATVIDTFKGTENEEAHKGFKENEILTSFKKSISDFKIENTSIIIGDTIESSCFIDDESIDLLFIDADHSTKAVYEDFKTYFDKVKDTGIISGHDITWESVRIALDKLNILRWVKTYGNMWWIKKSDILPNNGNVTVTISSKDRYDTLYQTICLIATQTYKPYSILIFDDSTNKIDLRTIVKWQMLFELLESKNIKIEFLLTNNGQNANHQIAKEKCISQYIWRVDDDLIFDSNTLEKLMETVNSDNKISAVSPLITTNGVNISLDHCSGLLDDITVKGNIQWVRPNDFKNKNLIKVEHLHCSFLYKRNVTASYELRLSRVGHREETIFTYRITDQGGTCVINPNIVMYHLKENNGGIRSDEYKIEMFQKDENHFIQELHYLKSLDEIRNSDIYYLNEGIGDHYVFKNFLKNNIKKKSIIFCTFPEVFNDLNKDRFEIKSLAEGINYIKENFKLATHDDFAVYKYIQWFNWKTSLYDAFKQIYLPRHKK
jgi:predicted O-methyltransferase YrrM